MGIMDSSILFLGLRGAKENPKNQILLFFNWNLLPLSLFQPKQAEDIFRIFRKIFGGCMGGGVRQ
jgi:hypothetical protein